MNYVRVEKRDLQNFNTNEVIESQILPVLQLCVFLSSGDGFYVCVLFGVAGLIPQELKVQTKVTLSRQGSCNKSRGWAELCLDQCVCAVRVVEVPVFFCLCSGCNNVTGVGGLNSLLEEHWKL